MLYADDEPSAEVYSAASDRSQASLVFNVAKQIVEMTPALMKRSKIMAATKRIVNYSNAGFYQVLSADVGCVSEDTVLQLSDGSLKRADEIQPGDMILSFDGLTPVFDEVVSVREEEPSPMVEVLTGHGRRTCVTEKHPFYKMEPGRRMQDLTHVYDWEEAYELKKNDRLAVALGWPENYESSSSISTLEAWALGAWAGDGDCTHFRFINPDKPVIEKMRGFLEGIGSGLKSTYSTRQKEAGKDLYQDPIEHSITGKGKRSPGREWIRENFGQETRCHDKVIPPRVLKGSREVWAAFIAGYLDTDGTVRRPVYGTTVSICSVSRTMLEQLQMLLARLGINASVRTDLKITIAGKPQVRKLWKLLKPYMVQAKKCKRFEKLACEEIYRLQRACESDKVLETQCVGEKKSISIEMKRFQTHATDGLITHNSKHGLNISAAIIDEVHVVPRELVNVLTKGASDARRQPLTFIITTAGDNRESVAYELHQKAQDILENKREDPTFYPVIYSLPMDEDWRDEKNWYKVNPSLGYTIKIDGMRAACRDAEQNPADEVTFRWLRLNQWVGSTVAWIPDSVVAKGTATLFQSDLIGRECYGGLDLSSSEDITALALMFPPRYEGEKYILKVFCWVPEETIPRRERQTGFPYSKWKAQGYLEATPGNIIDYAYIEDKIEELSKIYNIREIAFDRSGSNMLVERLEGMGLTVVPFGQGFKDMSSATRELHDQLMKENILYDNYIFRWHVSNVNIDVDSAGNQKITKKRSKGKVDAAVAAVMALDRCIRHENPQGSVYDDPNHGLLSF